MLLNESDQILLQLRNKVPEVDHWSIPGGKVEYLEQLEDACVRELKEELGIDVEVIDLLCVTNHIVPEEDVHWVSPAFLVRSCAGQVRNLDPNTTKCVEWFSLCELPEKLTVTTQHAMCALRRRHSN